MSFSRLGLLVGALAAALLAGCRPPAVVEARQPYAVGLLRAGGRCGAYLAVRPGTPVVLDGSESGLAGGAGAPQPPPELTCRWKQTAGPEVRLARPDLLKTEICPRQPGTCRFELVVLHGASRSLPSEVEILVSPDAPVAAESAPDATPVRAGADFALYRADLGELVRVFPQKTGLTLRVDPGWLRPEQFRDRTLDLMVRNVPPEVALELAARLAGAGFVRDGQNSALLANGLGWLAAERQEARLQPAGGLAPADTGGELLKLVRESCRAALFACPTASIEWRADTADLQVIGPESLHRRVRAVLAAVASGDARMPPLPPASDDERLRQATLGRNVTVRLVAVELSEAGLELGRVLGVPLAWEEPAGAARAATAPRISLEARDRPAGEVLAEIERQGGFRGHSWVAGGGVWLWRSAPREGSAENRWTTAVVRAYPLGWLENKGLLPGMVGLAIKKRLRPESWADPATLCAYHADSGRLVVINTPDVQDQVVRLMHELAGSAK